MGTQRCPRRDETGDLGGELPDTWVDHMTCSYCGSLRPDEFMRRISSGEVIGTTTKTYKAYLNDPWNKVYYSHMSKEQMIEFVRLFNEGVIKTDFQFNPKPYFMATVTNREV